MRKHLAVLVVLAFLLFVMGATAQTSSSSEPQQPTTTTTQQSTSTTDQDQGKSSAKSGSDAIEGCLMKEGSDYFLIPRSGNPIQLQVGGQDLTAHEGHRVKVRGSESSASTSGAGTSQTGGTAGTAAGTSAPSASSGSQSSSGAVGQSTAGAGSQTSGSAGAVSGSGNDLHRLSEKQIMVSKVDHVADSCPANWNPKVPSKSDSTK